MKAMNPLQRFLFTAAAISLLASVSPPVYAEEAAAAVRQTAGVAIEDGYLERDLRRALHKPEGALTAEDLSSLTELSAGNISSLSGLEYAVNLEKLHLANGKVSDLTPLSGLKKLREITIVDNEIKDIAPLRGLTNVTQLNLERNMISDLSPLENLTSLTSLYLNANNIADIRPLHALQKLELVSLNDNYIERLDGLEGLPALKSLEINNNLLRDIAPLAANRSLSGLNIGYNQVSDLSPLKELDLHAIQIDHTDISDLGVLQNMTSLQIIYWNHSPLTEPSALFLDEFKKKERATVYGDEYWMENYALPKVFIDGKVHLFGVHPDLYHDATMVPLRELFELLGADVEWNNGTITAMSGSTRIELAIGSKNAQINGQPVELEAGPVLLKDHTLVPLRFVAEAFGLNVEWNGDKRWIMLNGQEPQSLTTNAGNPSL